MGTIPLHLAPMASVTNPPMRVVSRRCGAARCYTEMVNARAIARRIPNALGLLACLPEEDGTPIVAHLYGADENDLAEAATYVTDTGRFCAIDLNAGCPSPTITRLGAGSALIRTPERIAKLIEAIRSRTHLPVTLKTRLGPNPRDIRIFEIVRLAENAGVSAIAVHARFTSEGHSGAPHYDLLRETKSIARVPIWGNGNGRDQAGIEALKACGVDAVLVARGAIGNPWIFSDCRRPSGAEVLEMLRFHLELEYRYRALLVQKGFLASEGSESQAAVAAFRSHLFRYLSGRPGANNLRAGLSGYRTVEDIMRAVEPVLQD